MRPAPPRWRSLLVVNSRVAARLPVPVSQARPRRPWPAVWRVAVIHTGPVSRPKPGGAPSALVGSAELASCEDGRQAQWLQKQPRQREGQNHSGTTSTAGKAKSAAA